MKSTAIAAHVMLKRQQRLFAPSSWDVRVRDVQQFYMLFWPVAGVLIA